VTVVLCSQLCTHIRFPVGTGLWYRGRAAVLDAGAVSSLVSTV